MAGFLDGARRRSDDSGLGIVEILVSMSLLAIVLAALAPLLINVVRVTAHNQTIAFASQVANERIEAARAAAGSCAAYQSWVNSPGPAAAEDGRGVSVVVEQTPVVGSTITCDAGHPTQLLQVSVRVVSTGEVIVRTATVIAVPGFA